LLPSAIAKTERKEKFGVLLREHRLGRPRRLRCIGMTSPLGCGFKVPKRFGGLRGTLIESKQRTRNFDSENRLPRFDYCAPPAIRGFQQHRSTITRWSGVERLSLRFASPPSSLRFRGRRCPRPAVNGAIEGASCRARRNGCPSRPWQVAWRHQEGGSGRPVE